MFDTGKAYFLSSMHPPVDHVVVELQAPQFERRVRRKVENVEQNLSLAVAYILQVSTGLCIAKL